MALAPARRDTRLVRAAVGAACSLLLGFDLTGAVSGVVTDAAADPIITTERWFAIDVQDRGSTTSTPLRAEDFRATWGGRDSDIVDIAPYLDPTTERAAAEHQVVLYFEAALLSPSSLRKATAGLAESAERLAALGTVSVVMANPEPEEFLQSSRDPTEIQAALDEVSEESKWVGGLYLARQDFVRRHEDQSTSGDSQEALNEELTLLHQSRNAFFEALALRSNGQTHLAILVQDGFESQPEDFYLQHSDTAAVPGESYRSLHALQTRNNRALAASGWTIMSLAVGTAPAVFDSPLSALRDISMGSGGPFADDAGAIAGLVERLAHRRLLKLRMTDTAQGAVRELKIAHRKGTVTLAAPLWGSATTPLEIVAARTLQQLQEDYDREHSLAVFGNLNLEEVTTDAKSGVVQVEVLVDLAHSPRLPPDPLFRVAVASEGANRGEASPHIFQMFVPSVSGDFTRAKGWLFREFIAAGEDVDYLGVSVEEVHTGLWGGAIALPGRAIATATSDDVIVTNGNETGDRRSPGSIATASIGSENIIKLLPPTKRPVTGRVRIRTLVTTTAIDQMKFWLDGKLMSTDKSAPFYANLDFGSQPQAHTLKVEAFSSSGVKLGEDILYLNQRAEPFRVAISRVSIIGKTEIELEVNVGVPSDHTLDRVEIFHNETQVATLGSRPPFETRFSASLIGAADFVRAVAYLADGSSLEDARLLASQGGGERVNVNLVELFVVATGRDGEPAKNLVKEDFRIKLKGKPQAIERFELAEEQPLVLGVVVDTSNSMWSLMPDTKKAAIKFLSETVQTEDRAFLVDFDTRPRLAQATTGDLGLLFRKFAGLTANGFTALYDAIIFSLLQFEETSSRRALVLLSDGDDYKSEYGARKCIQYGRSLGVPVYIIAMGGIHDPRRGMRKIDLEGITEATGGRIHYISAMSDLDGAYGQINRELRSQYILAFSTDAPLSDEQLDSIKLEVPGKKGLNVRTAIGRSVL